MFHGNLGNSFGHGENISHGSEIISGKFSHSHGTAKLSGFSSLNQDLGFKSANQGSKHVSWGHIPSSNVHAHETIQANSSRSSLGSGLSGSNIHGFETHSTAPSLVGVSKYEEVRYSSNVPKWEVEVPGSSVTGFETIKHSSNIPAVFESSGSISSRSLDGFDTIQYSSNLPSRGSFNSKIHEIESIGHSTRLPSLGSALGGSKLGFESIQHSSNWDTALPISKSNHFETIQTHSSFPSSSKLNEFESAVNLSNAKINGFESIRHSSNHSSLGSGLSGSSIHGFETHSTAPSLVGVSKYEEVRYSSNVPKWEVEVPGSSVTGFETIKHSSNIPAAFESSGSISSRSSHGFGTIQHGSIHSSHGSSGQSFEIESPTILRTTNLASALNSGTDIIF